MSRRSHRLAPTIATVALVGMVAVGGVSALSMATAPQAGAATAADLPEFPTMVQPTARVADGVLPPTNSWISGAVYDMAGVDAPTWVGGGLAFRAHDGSVDVAVPEVTGYSDFAIMQTWENRATPEDPESQAIELMPPGATTYLLTDWDDISAELTWYAGSTAVGRLRAVEGWPYVMYTAASDQTLAVNRTLVADGGRWTWTGPTGQQLNVVTSGGVSNGGIALAAGETVHVFGTPQGATSADIATLVAGAVPVTGTRTETSVEGSTATATFVLETGGRDTVLAQMAHQDYGLPTLTGRWENPTGWASGAVGTRFSTSAPTWKVSSALDLTGLSEGELAMLRDQVRADVGSVLEFPSDTYFGGKALYRAANLYTLATQLGLGDEAGRIKTAMVAQLDMWMDVDRCAGGIVGQCFGYDATNRTVVPDTDGFYVASMLNDHHFHYGYLLYAAAVLAQDDPGLVSAYAPMAQILAADIAAEETTDTTIQRRSFDDWRGHSWANGLGGGMDGNDQESTSEAMNAWAGLALWSRVAGDAQMFEHAQWLLAFEAATAKAYWWNPYRGETSTAPIYSMIFQGKATYETWFSGDASAKTAIEVIPMGPSQLAFLSSLGEERIIQIAGPLFEGDYAGRPLIDWNTAFLGLADPDRALQIAQGLPGVDNGNTRSYLYALIMAGQAADDGGGPDPTGEPTTPTTEPTEPTTEPTTQDPRGDAVDPYAVVGMDEAADMSGISVTGGVTTPAGDGDWIAFDADFGEGGVRDAVIRYASGAVGGVSGLVEIRVGSPTAAVLGSAAVSHSGGWDAFREVPFNVTDITGVRRVYVTFTSGVPDDFARLASIQFRR